LVVVGLLGAVTGLSCTALPSSASGSRSGGLRKKVRVTPVRAQEGGPGHPREGRREIRVTPQRKDLVRIEDS
jgi:hypothetical protein